jgi:hypothetical protein
LRFRQRPIAVDLVELGADTNTRAHGDRLDVFDLADDLDLHAVILDGMVRDSQVQPVRAVRAVGCMPSQVAASSCNRVETGEDDSSSADPVARRDGNGAMNTLCTVRLPWGTPERF